LMLQGRTERNEIVHLEGGAVSWIGQMIPVEILRANKHSLTGRALESLPAAVRMETPRLGNNRSLPLLR